MTLNVTVIIDYFIKINVEKAQNAFANYYTIVLNWKLKQDPLIYEKDHVDPVTGWN